MDVTERYCKNINISVKFAFQPKNCFSVNMIIISIKTSSKENNELTKEQNLTRFCKKKNVKKKWIDQSIIIKNLKFKVESKNYESLTFNW